LSHPLGEYVIADAANMECSPAEIEFDISNHPTRISMVEKLRGQSGWMRLEHLRIDSFDREEYLLFSGFNDAGANLDQETCRKTIIFSGRCVTSCFCGGRFRSSSKVFFQEPFSIPTKGLLHLWFLPL